MRREAVAIPSTRSAGYAKQRARLGAPDSENNQVLLFRTQEVQQTPTVIAASSGTAIYTMPDVHLYESFDLTHDEGDAVLYAATPASYNFNTSYVDNESGLVVSGWAAVAISFLSAAQSSRRLTLLGAGV